MGAHPPISSRATARWRAVETIGPDRVLFGSDFSINDPSSVLARIESSFLSREQKGRVLSENLEALLARYDLP